MARPLDLRQRQELAEFVNALFAAAEYPSTAEWARDTGYHASNLSDLRNAKTGVDGYNLLRLIRAAAVRTGQTPEELAQVTAAESPESIRHHLATLTKLVTRALGAARSSRRSTKANKRANGSEAAIPVTGEISLRSSSPVDFTLPRAYAHPMLLRNSRKGEESDGTHNCHI